MSSSLWAIAAATAAASRPEAPGVATPLPNLDGALEIRARVARGRSTAAGVPVDGVDLVQANIVGAVVIVVFSVGISAAFGVGDAFAALLRPSTELAAVAADAETKPARSQGRRASAH